MIFEGENIYFSTLDIEKEADIYSKWSQDPDVIENLEIFPRKPADKKRTLKLKLEEGYEIFSINVKDGDVLIGNFEIEEKIPGVFNIGLVIGEKDYWGKGYGTEATKLGIKYLFEVKKAKKITLDVKVLHTPAVHIYEKCGFKIMRNFRKYVERIDQYRDSYFMELSAEDYLKCQM